MLGQLSSLSELFNNAVFRIPDYQRGYAWTDKELQELWDDLDLLASYSSQPHYVGVLTLEKVPDKEVPSALGEGQEWLKDGSAVYYVVDGQQRLTTILILLFELIKRHEVLSPTKALTSSEDRDSVMAKYIRCPNKLVSGVFGYRLGYASDAQTDAFLRQEVFNDSNVSAAIKQSRYTQQLLGAKKFFAEKFNKDTDPQKRFKLLVERFRFNTFEVSSELDVCMTFEAINNRGKRLSDLEKLKSRLIYLAGLLAGSNSDTLNLYRNMINNRWKKVYAMLGWSPQIQLDDDEFLVLVWTIYYGRYGETPRSEHLFKHEFFPGTILKEKEWKPMDDFSKALASAAGPWVAMEYPKQIPHLLEQKALSKSIPPQASSFLEKLSRLGAHAFRPLVLAALVRHQEAQITDEVLIELLKESERYVFIVLGLSERRSDTGRNKYGRIAHDLYANPTSVANLINKIRQDAAAQFVFYGQEFHKSVRRWYEMGNKHGFYGWNRLRYMLFEYEQHLYDTQFTPNSGKAPLLWTTVAGEKLEESVEHIYPQAATDCSWIASFGQTSNTLLLNALGNLLLLSQSKNATLQNFSYAKKAYGDNNYPQRYQKGSCSEQEVAYKWSNWTPEAIRDRTVDLLDFICTRWQLDPTTWAEVKKHILEYICRPTRTAMNAAEQECDRETRTSD